MPLCGNKIWFSVREICQIGYHGWVLECNDCGVNISAQTIEELIKKWNTRAKSENEPLTIDEVKSLKNR